MIFDLLNQLRHIRYPIPIMKKGLSMAVCVPMNVNRHRMPYLSAGLPRRWQLLMLGLLAGCQDKAEHVKPVWSAISESVYEIGRAHV